MKRLFVTTSIGAVGLFTLLLVPLQGCTDLTETPISSISPGNFYHTEGEVLAALGGVAQQQPRESVEPGVHLLHGPRVAYRARSRGALRQGRLIL